MGFLYDQISEQYFKIKTNHYDLRTKNQMVIRPSRISLGDQAVRIKGASMWNKLDKDLLKYRFKNDTKATLDSILLEKILSYGEVVDHVNPVHLWRLVLW